MPGTKPLIVIGDTDSLIALLHEDDSNHKKAVETVTKLLEMEAQTVFPLTAIAETITTIKRKLNKPALVESVIDKVTNGSLLIEDVDTKMLQDALKVFNPKATKKNTIFDALVSATAKKLDTKIIFSLDQWYKKLGFTLASNL